MEQTILPKGALPVEQIQGLLGLPLLLLSILAAGYLSYRVAYNGKDATHKTIDTLFLVSVFALIAQTVVHLVWPRLAELLGNRYLAEIGSGMLGLIIALGAASFWRKWGEDWISQALKWAGISHSDRYISAWQSVIAKSRVAPSSLVIRKTDGSMVMSDRLADFNDLPFGSCIQGQDGSVALYITHKWPVGADGWEERDPNPVGDWGAEVTIIPASSISDISLRAD